MFKKQIALAAVAMFCISAFAVVVDADDSAAEETNVNYSFYLYLVDGTNTYSSRLADVTVSGSEPSSTLFGQALEAACTAAGLTATVAGSWISSIEANGHTYAGSPTSDWGTDHYNGFTTYYVDGNSWKTIYDYTESSMIAITFGTYAVSEPSDASKYYKNQFSGSDPYWTLLPNCDIVEYKIYIQLNDNDGSSFSKWIKSTQLGISGNSLKSARALGAAAEGFTINNSGYATGVSSIVAGGHTYASHGTYGSDDYYGYCAYYATADNKWKDLQAVDLESATTIAHVYDLYKMTDPSDSSYFYHEPAYGMDAYWTKLPAVSPSGDNGNNDNKLIYIGAIAIVVFAIAAAAFAIVKKH